MKQCLLTIIVLSMCSSLHSQRLGLDILYGKQTAEIPFKLENGFITIQVRFDNVLPVKFIFDTGAEHSILFHKSYADLLGIEYSKRIEIKGSDLSTSQYALIARDIKMRLEDQIPVERDVLVLEETLQLFQESLGFDIDGIIGGSFFRGLVVQIDYGNEKIKLSHPERFVAPKKGFKEFDIDIRSNKPYLLTKSIMNKTDTLNTKLLIDTGAAIPFLLHSNTDSSIVIPDHVIQGTIGQGLSGNLMGYIGKIEGLHFGNFKFNQILTLFQDLAFIKRANITLTRNGILGNELLSRFTIIIDYLHEKLYLKPEKRYDEEFEYDKSGLIIFAFGSNLRQYYVKDVFIDTPAYEADIRPGDIIKRIGWWKDRHWTLEKITKVLQKRDGKTINMVIERNGVKMKKRFKLRDFFEES